MASRSIDHVVLPTASVDMARARLSALGFEVAPTGTHPFGTENCCVYLADGSFVEPLAVRDRSAAQAAADAGNLFVAHDLRWRARNGDEGFSALVFGTEDADADHGAFQGAGVAAGPMLEFSRPMTDANGRTGTATFKLAFAGDPLAPDTLFFTCERVGVPAVDRTSLETHENGATGLVAVALAAQSPADWGLLLNAVSHSRVAPVLGEGIVVKTPNGVIFVLNASEIEQALGVRAVSSGLQLKVVSFRVPDVRKVGAMLAGRAIVHHWSGDRLVVPPAPGQGAIFAFEERP